MPKICDPSDCELLKLKQDFGLTIDDFADYKVSLSAKAKESEFMTSLFLFRDKDSDFGRLFLRGVHLCDTLENPLYKFPIGHYGLSYTFSPKFNGKRYEITNIPGRTRILIHEGNYRADSKGCVLVGFRQGEKLVSSKLCLDRLNSILFDLKISKIFVNYA